MNSFSPANGFPWSDHDDSNLIAKMTKNEAFFFSATSPRQAQASHDP